MVYRQLLFLPQFKISVWICNIIFTNVFTGTIKKNFLSYLIYLYKYFYSKMHVNVLLSSNRRLFCSASASHRCIDPLPQTWVYHKYICIYHFNTKVCGTEMLAINGGLIKAYSPHPLLTGRESGISWSWTKFTCRELVDWSLFAPPRRCGY